MDFEQLVIGNTTFLVLPDDPLRPLTAQEREALRMSMEQYGCITQVLTDKDGFVLDGLARLRIAVQYGWPYIPWRVLQCEEGVQYNLRETLNYARRHLHKHERKGAGL